MLECGILISEIKKKTGYNLHSISTCLLSHQHRDHCKALKDTVKAGIDTYALQDVFDSVGVHNHRTHAITPKQSFRVNKYTILPFEVPHDVKNLGFLITDGKDKLVFLIDCLYCPYKFEGLTHIMIGINYDKGILQANTKKGVIASKLACRIMQSHMELNTAIEFLEANDLSKVQEIYVLHCSEHNIDKNVVLNTIQKKTGKLVKVSTGQSDYLLV